MIFQDKDGDTDAELSYSCVAEVDNESIGKRYFHHCKFMNEKNHRTWKQVHHVYEESLLPSQSFFAHTQVRGPVHELSSCQRRKSSREMKYEKNQDFVGSMMLERKSRSTNFKPFITEEVSRN